MESRILKIAQFIASKRHKPFVWGKNDCHTFVLELNDILYNENSVDTIYEKYNNIKGCYRLAKTIDAVEYMQSLGYESAKQIMNGDVILVKHKQGYYSHVALDGNLYSMEPDRGLVVANKTAFKKIDYTVWRRK
jgi:hypothetical protein